MLIVFKLELHRLCLQPIIGLKKLVNYQLLIFKLSLFISELNVLYSQINWIDAITSFHP